MVRATCYRCVRPIVGCVCDLVTRVEPRTRIVVVQHWGERRHPFGTARLARLGLANLRMETAMREATGRTTCPPCAPPGAVLLYPSSDAVDVRELGIGPPCLVAVDGTWSTARKVVRDNAWLSDLPRVKVTLEGGGRYRIRRAPDPTRQLSTIEAIVAALRVIEPETVGVEGLLRAFDGMIDRQIAIEARARRT